MTTIKCKGCGKEIEADFLSPFCICDDCGREISMPNLVSAYKALDDGGFVFAKAQFSAILEMDKGCLSARLGLLLCEHERSNIYELVGDNVPDIDTKTETVSEHDENVQKHSNEAVREITIECGKHALEKGFFDIARELFETISTVYPDDATASQGIALSKKKMSFEQYEARLAEEQRAKEAKIALKNDPKHKAKLKKIFIFSGIGVAVIAILLVILIPFLTTPRLKFKKIEGGYMVAGMTNAEKVTSVEIPAEYKGKKVISLGEHAFFGCYSLASITLPDSLTSIGNYSFNCCFSLTSITIPDSITSIGSGAFFNCTSLATIYCEAPSQPSGWSSGWKEGCDATVIWNCTTPPDVSPTPEPEFKYSLKDGAATITGCTVYGNEAVHLVIPSEIDGRLVNAIADYAFEKMTTINGVTIPDSIISIGHGAFSDCTSLEIINMHNRETSIGYGIFSGCTSLESVTIPKGISDIRIGMFSGCTSLKSVTIPDNVTSISATAFQKCTSLETIIIPDSVIYLGENAFNDCTSLTRICAEVGSQPSTWNGNWKGNCSAQALWGYSDEWNDYEYTTSGTEATITGYKGTKNELVIPSNIYGYTIVAIGDNAFRSNRAIRSVEIPDGVTKIGDMSFSECASLENIILPESVTQIRFGAFSSCGSLTSIVIPSGVELMDTHVFIGCQLLATINCNAPSKPSGWNSNWKYGCNATVIWGSATGE